MASSVVSDNTTSAGHEPPVQNELLCFIREKCKVITVDDLAKICSDFYREEEIYAAKALLEVNLPNRLPKRAGSHKCRATIDDLIKACLDPSVCTPLYFAVDLKRLPPVECGYRSML